MTQFITNPMVKCQNYEKGQNYEIKVKIMIKSHDGEKSLLQTHFQVMT